MDRKVVTRLFQRDEFCFIVLNSSFTVCNPIIPLTKSIYAKRAIIHTGRDERLLVLGTQTRAPPVCLVPFIWSKYFSAVVSQFINCDIRASS